MTHNAEDVRVFLVWDTDVTGGFLDSIWASREAAEQRAETLKYGAWVDPDWTVGARIDGTGAI